MTKKFRVEYYREARSTTVKDVRTELVKSIEEVG